MLPGEWSIPDSGSLSGILLRRNEELNDSPSFFIATDKRVGANRSRPLREIYGMDSVLGGGS